MYDLHVLKECAQQHVLLLRPPEVDETTTMHAHRCSYVSDVCKHGKQTVLDDAPTSPTGLLLRAIFIEVKHATKLPTRTIKDT